MAKFIEIFQNKFRGNQCLNGRKNVFQAVNFARPAVIEQAVSSVALVLTLKKAKEGSRDLKELTRSNTITV